MLPVIQGATLLILGSKVKVKLAKFEFVAAGGYLTMSLLGQVSLRLVGWLFVLRINGDLAIFQPYLDLEAGDNQSLKIQVARPRA